MNRRQIPLGLNAMHALLFPLFFSLDICAVPYIDNKETAGRLDMIWSHMESSSFIYRWKYIMVHPILSSKLTACMPFNFTYQNCGVSWTSINKVGCQTRYFIVFEKFISNQDQKNGLSGMPSFTTGNGIHKHFGAHPTLVFCFTGQLGQKHATSLIFYQNCKKWNKFIEWKCWNASNMAGLRIFWCEKTNKCRHNARRTTR